MEINFSDDLLDDPIDDSQESLSVEPEQSDTEEVVDNEDSDLAEEQETVDYSDNVVYSFLQDYGVSDPSRMQFEDESGETEEVDFNSLSPQEQKNVLKQLTDPGISDYEYSVINYLRQNNTTFDKVVDYFAEQRLQEYLNANPDTVPQKTYSIDEYTDDELYIADLKTKYTDFSDEELLSKLESARENEELFTKEVNALRTQYKALEDQEIANSQAREQQDYEDLRTNLITAVDRFNEIALDYANPKSDSLVIEDTDKREMLSYLLDRDKTGKSQFAKDIEDLDALTELAWFRVKGAEVLASTTRYYKNEIEKLHKENAKLKSQIEKKSKSASVVVPSNPNLPKKFSEESVLGGHWDAYV